MKVSAHCCRTMVKLFEQLAKRVALTEEGRVLTPYARRAVAALEDARAAMSEVRGLERGRVRVGASTTAGMYLVPGLIADFKRRYPQIDIRLGIGNTRQIEEEIIRNEYDLGFVGGHLASDEVTVLPWVADEIVLALPPAHRLASKRQIKMHDLAGERFIVREQGSATRAVVDEGLGKLNFVTEAGIEIGNPEAVKQAVASNLGIAFLSKLAMRTELLAGMLVAKTVKELTLVREMKIVHRRNKHLSRATSALIEMAQA